MVFHEKLVKLRKRRGWSQTEFGQRVGVHVTHVSRLENGKVHPSADLLQKIAHTLEVSMDYLMDKAADEPTAVSVRQESLPRRLEMIEQLDDADRQTVINVIDCMLTKKKMLDLLTRQPVDA